MKRTSYILLAALMSMSVYAQDFDRLTLANTEIQGTARYVSMAGAFTSLGGDVSAAVDNPAALGVFRHGEVSLTGDFTNKRVTAGNSNDYALRVSVPQVAWVLHFNHSDRQKGLLHSSFMFQYHRLQQYNRNSTMQADGATLSLTDLMANMTNGLTESSLQSNDWYLNQDIGTLSKLGYELYLINPVTADPTKWNSLLNEGETVNNKLRLTESGYYNQYSFSWGCDISNKIYFGLGAELRNISYGRVADYSETFAGGGSFTTHTSVVRNGFGFDATFGLIARPTDFLRLGVSYQTPVWMTMKTRATSSGTSYIDASANFSGTDDSNTDNLYRMPMRVTAGMALQMSKGVLSFEYDYQHQPGTKYEDIHKLKAGAEVVIVNNLYLRAGYAFQSPFLKNEMVFTPEVNDWRADTDYRQFLRQHYGSFGLGYRNNFIIAEAAYQFGYEKSRQYAFTNSDANLSSMSYDLYAMTHRVVVTLAWTMRR